MYWITNPLNHAGRLAQGSLDLSRGFFLLLPSSAVPYSFFSHEPSLPSFSVCASLVLIPPSFCHPSPLSFSCSCSPSCFSSPPPLRILSCAMHQASQGSPALGLPAPPLCMGLVQTLTVFAKGQSSVPRFLPQALQVMMLVFYHVSIFKPVTHHFPLGFKLSAALTSFRACCAPQSSSLLLG